ncbi:hypothetical protein M1E08_18300 [Erwinia sp. PK3-005]
MNHITLILMNSSVMLLACGDWNRHRKIKGFTAMFSRWKKNGATPSTSGSHTQQAGPLLYQGDKTLTALLNAEFNKHFLRVVNHNIVSNTSSFSRGKMLEAMQKDLPRMEYYIEGRPVSAPGNLERSLANFHQIINGNASLLWLNHYIDSVSAFLHQGIFVDICESIPWWEDDHGERWDIRMISLDQKRSQNAFDINCHGYIKITAQSSVTNLILKNGDIILTDRRASLLQLQVTLLMMKGGNGSCMVANALNGADRAILKISCQGKM